MRVFTENVFQKIERYTFFPSKEALQHLYVPLEIAHGSLKEYASFSPQSPTGYFFVFVVKGNLFLDAAQKKGQVHATEYVWMDAAQKQTYYTGTQGAELFFLHFDGVDAEHLFLQMKTMPEAAIIPKNPKTVKKSFKQILQMSKEPKALSPIEASLKIYELICMALEYVAQSEHPKINHTENYEESVLFAENYIQENLRTPLTVKEIAKAVHMSASHFSRLFKEQTGFSPYDYVLNARLQKAKKYLASDEKSIEQIAFLTGFNSTSNFIYCFTGNVGVSPLKYRKQNQQK